MRHHSNPQAIPLDARVDVIIERLGGVTGTRAGPPGSSVQLYS